jgi:hypothetical protein
MVVANRNIYEMRMAGLICARDKLSSSPGQTKALIEAAKSAPPMDNPPCWVLMRHE